jgi:hypothetical protein
LHKIILAIKEKLRKYPEAGFQIDDDEIQVLPTDAEGFTVSMEAHESEFTVGFNGWHEEFTDEETAMDCFALGLSEDCRLKEWSRGGTIFKWTMEYILDGKWVEDSTTGLLITPFWKKAEIRILQNKLLPTKQELPTGSHGCD